MNGAAMDCRQDRALRSQHRDNSGLRTPGYHQHTDRPHQQNSQLQHSKAMNYHSLSDHYLRDGLTEYVEDNDEYSGDTRLGLSNENVWDPRPSVSKMWNRVPLELPVPQFEIDEHYVGELPNRMGKVSESSKNLDLDTRIDLLIKSKALAVMHPIFSELEESEKSSDDSDYELFSSKPKRAASLKHKCTSSSEDLVQWSKNADDPETPLSRPPSPFLSRATYLFWFNKAIELKQQAQEQEQALLEKAAKKLIQDSFSTDKINRHTNCFPEKKLLSKNLVDEVCKELKEAVRQEFITQVLETTVFSTLDDWWDQQKLLEQEVKDIKSTKPYSSEVIGKFVNKSKQHSSEACNDTLALKATFDSFIPLKSQPTEMKLHFENTNLNSHCCKNDISYDEVKMKNKEICYPEEPVDKNEHSIGRMECNSSVEGDNGGLLCKVPNFRKSKSNVENLKKTELVDGDGNLQICDSPMFEGDLTVKCDNSKEIVISILNTILDNVEQYIAERCDVLNRKQDEESSYPTDTMEVTSAEETKG